MFIGRHSLSQKEKYVNHAARKTQKKVSNETALTLTHTSATLPDSHLQAQVAIGCARGVCGHLSAKPELMSSDIQERVASMYSSTPNECSPGALQDRILPKRLNVS